MEGVHLLNDPSLACDKSVSASGSRNDTVRTIPVHNQNPDTHLFCHSMHPDAKIARCEHPWNEENGRVLSAIFSLLRRPSDIRVTYLQLAMVCCSWQDETSVEPVLRKVVRSARGWRVDDRLWACGCHGTGLDLK